MCTVCCSIAPLATDCVLGSPVPPMPLGDRVFGNSGAKAAPQSADRASPDAFPAPAAADVATKADMAEYLTDGYWNDNGNNIRHSFDSGDITVNLGALSSDGKQLARWAFEAWEAVADLNFIENAVAQRHGRHGAA